MFAAQTGQLGIVNALLDWNTHFKNQPGYKYK